MDFLTAIDELDDLVHEAKAVPFTDQVRLDAERLNAVLERLLAGLPPGLERHPAIDAHTRLAEVVRAARPVPLTGEVRLDKEDVYDLLDQMRAELPMVMAGMPPLDPRARPLLDALDAVERLVTDGRGLLRRGSHVDADRLRAAVDEVHAAAPVDVRRQDRDDLLGDLDRLVTGARPARGGRLRLEPAAALDALDRLRGLVDATCRG